MRHEHDALAAGRLGRQPHVVDRMAGGLVEIEARGVVDGKAHAARSIQQELAADFVGQRGDVAAHAAQELVAGPISKTWSMRA